MNFPSDLHGLVEQLAIAKKKLANIEAEVAKLANMQEEVAIIQAKLMAILDAKGFTVDAVDLLLAAR